MARCYHDQEEFESDLTIEVAREDDILKEGQGLDEIECDKNPGHRDFIPFKDLTLEHLPSANRNAETLEYLKHRGSRVVRLVVGRKLGFGYVMRYNNQYFIRTNNHVVKTEDEVKHCTVEFHYDDGSRSSVITSRGVELLNTDPYRDTTFFTFHPIPEFLYQLDYDNIKVLSINNQTISFPTITGSGKINSVCCIGHPHGAIKQITFGRSLEKFDNQLRYIKDSRSDCQYKNIKEHTRTTWCVRILRWIVIIASTIHLAQCVQFGPDNSYTCHCFNDELCNKDTGDCDGVCARGWSGATCQKQNVAHRKSSKQEKSNRAERVPVNRNTDCSNRDRTSKWWRVDLLEEYPIKHITIQPYWDVGSINGISICVINDNKESKLCYKGGLSVSPPTVKDIECNQVITGRYVNISNDFTRHSGRYLTFCHVEIYVCSRGTFGSDCTNFCHCLNNERCSETGQCPGRCANGWTGTTCSHACDNGTYGAGCSKLCSERNCLVETSPCNHINGSCEGGCTEGFYGEVCDMKCSYRKCKDSNLQCESKTGECIDGCQPGYQTADCTQECNNGTYGQDCKLDCSARFCNLESECNNIDGACNCSDGYQGIDCTVQQAIVFSRSGNEESRYERMRIIAIVVSSSIGLIIVVIVVLLIITKLRSKSRTQQSVCYRNDPLVTQTSSNNKNNQLLGEV